LIAFAVFVDMSFIAIERGGIIMRREILSCWMENVYLLEHRVGKFRSDLRDYLVYQRREM